MNPPTKKQIVGGFNRKEKWASELIFDTCQANIFILAAGILKNDEDATDLTIEIFLKLQRVTRRQENIKQIYDMVYQSTKNLSLDWVKKRRSEQKYLSDPSNAQPVITESEMVRNETSAALHYEISRCKHKLTPQVQRVFDLYFIHEKSISEIAIEMNIEAHTVRNLKAGALQKLRLEMVPRKSFVFTLTILP